MGIMAVLTATDGAAMAGIAAGTVTGNRADRFMLIDKLDPSFEKISVP